MRPLARRGSLLAAVAVAALASMLTAAAPASASCPSPVHDAYSTSVLADGPIAYYRLDEASGTTMCDSSPSANNGTYNSTGVTHGIPGALLSSSDHAVSATGASGVIGVSDTNSPITGNHNFTLEGWFKSTGTVQNQVLVDIGQSGNGNIAGLNLWHTSGSCGTHGSSIAVDEFNGYNCWDTDAAAVGVNLFDQHWHYVAVTYNVISDELTAYVDGRSLGSETPNTVTHTFSLAASPIRVGNWVDTIVNQPFVGDADEVAVSGRALSVSRILAHYEASGYVPPVVSGISPPSGPSTGGTTVTITGSGFTGATAVDFGSAAAASFTVDSATKITATAPPGSGAVDVTVTTPVVTSATSSADLFTYSPRPVVSGISPSSGVSTGGTTITINGTGFTGATAVNFGTTAASLTFDSATQIMAKAPPGSGAVHVTVTTPGGTSATGSADVFTYTRPPISAAGGYSFSGMAPATISGTMATFSVADPSAVAGDYSATIDWGDGTSSTGGISGTSASFSVTGSHTYTAFGSYTITITIVENGNSANNATVTDFAGIASTSPSNPALIPGTPSATSSTTASESSSVIPDGLATYAYYEYGLDERYLVRGGAGAQYDHSTTFVSAGSGYGPETVVGSLTGLVPNALYHIRLVAYNSAGTVYGPDQTFTTAKDPAPGDPVVGRSVNAVPVSGTPYVKVPGSSSSALSSARTGPGFIPLTEARQLPVGTRFDLRTGTIKLTNATGKNKGPKLQNATLNGAIFAFSQAGSGKNKGLVTLKILEGAFPGAPSLSSCKAKKAEAGSPVSLIGAPLARIAVSRSVLSTLHVRSRGSYSSRGHYGSATARATAWTISDRCGGTLVTVQKDVVVVRDFVRQTTITLRAGQRYLARAR